MGSQILIYLASKSYNGPAATFILPAWTQLGVLKSGGSY